MAVLAGMLYPPISWPVPEVRKVAAAGGCSRNVSFITWWDSKNNCYQSVSIYKPCQERKRRQSYNSTFLRKCIRNCPLPIGAFLDQCKQTVINKHNLAKNPNWREAGQLAIYSVAENTAMFFLFFFRLPLLDNTERYTLPVLADAF